MSIEREELQALASRIDVLDQTVNGMQREAIGEHAQLRMYAALRAIELGAPEPMKIACDTLKAVFPRHYRDPDEYVPGAHWRGR